MESCEKLSTKVVFNSWKGFEVMKTLNESIFGTENMIVSPEDEESYVKFQEFCANELTDMIETFGKHEVYSLETRMDDISIEMKKMPTIPGSEDKKTVMEETVSDGENTIIPIKSKYLGILRLNNEKNVPYVKIGDKVHAGQVLGIMVTMNITNQIKSPASGEITDILEDDGKPVEYGQMLFLLKQ